MMVQVISSRYMCSKKRNRTHCTPQVEIDRGTAWYTFEKLKWLKSSQPLILSIGMLYYQEGFIILCFGLVSMLNPSELRETQKPQVHIG
jgi:hypothetical protein